MIKIIICPITIAAKIFSRTINDATEGKSSEKLHNEVRSDLVARASVESR
jgi:hypothetical protein